MHLSILLTLVPLYVYSQIFKMSYHYHCNPKCTSLNKSPKFASQTQLFPSISRFAAAAKTLENGANFFRKSIIINTTTSTLLSFRMSRPGNNVLYLEHAIIDT